MFSLEFLYQACILWFESKSNYSQILQLLYDQDIVDEDAILRWADEKEEADESDKVFVKQSEQFIQVRAEHNPFIFRVCLVSKSATNLIRSLILSSSDFHSVS